MPTSPAPLPLLIGQYDSPFVRRVAITLALYELPFQHQNWSVFRDAELIAPFNPLRRVPTLVLPSGEMLVESAAIVDALDDLVRDDQVLLPRRGPRRRAGMRLCALCYSLADKGVALVYEGVARESDKRSKQWVTRCNTQVRDTLQLLERERAAIPTPYWAGDQLSHPDIALAVVVHFLKQAAPRVLEAMSLPALMDHEARCHASPAFADHDAPLHFPT